MVAEIIRAVILLVGGTLSAALAILAFRVLRADKAEYKQNRRRSGKIFAPLSGDLETYFDGGRGERVAAGLAVDTRTNRGILRKGNHPDLSPDCK